MRRHMDLLMCICVLAASLALPADVAGADTEGFSFSGDCVVGIFFLPGDEDAVQRFLPDGYIVQADPVTRRAVLIVEGGSCTNGVVDGHPIGDFSFGEVLALIGAPEHDAASIYDFGAPTSGPAIAAGWSSLGLGSLQLLTHDLAVDIEEGPVTTLTANVPWRFSSYSFSIAATEAFAPNPDPNDRCCGWTEGSRGTVGGRFRLSSDGESGELDAAGTGTLEAEAGTPLAQMMGSDSFTGPAFIRRFHFDAIVTLFG